MAGLHLVRTHHGMADRRGGVADAGGWSAGAVCRRWEGMMGRCSNGEEAGL